jgi:hypothetical protein
MHLLKSRIITARSVTDVARKLQVVDCITYSGDSIYTYTGSHNILYCLKELLQWPLIQCGSWVWSWYAGPNVFCQQFLGKNLSYVNQMLIAPPSPLLKIRTYLDITHLDGAWLADVSFAGGWMSNWFKCFSLLQIWAISGQTTLGKWVMYLHCGHSVLFVVLHLL